jgi:hypothetical protein
MVWSLSGMKVRDTSASASFGQNERRQRINRPPQTMPAEDQLARNAVGAVWVI